MPLPIRLGSHLKKKGLQIARRIHKEKGNPSTRPPIRPRTGGR